MPDRIKRVGDPVAPYGSAPGFREFVMNSQRSDDTHRLGLAGELDIAAAGQVEDELVRIEASTVTRIVVDLTGLEFIDTAGLRVLLLAHARSRAGADRLVLVRGPSSLQRIFQLAGVDGRLPFMP